MSIVYLFELKIVTIYKKDVIIINNRIGRSGIMKKIKETYLLFLIVIGLVSLSIYSTYALFTEEYVVGGLDINTSTYNIYLSNINEYKRINTYSGGKRNITLNILNSTTNDLYYGIYTDSNSECVNVTHDVNSSLVRDSIGSGISRTIDIIVNNNCSYNYSFNLYVVTSDSSLLNKDIIGNKKIIVEGINVNDNISIVQESTTINNDSEEVKYDTLIDYVKSLYDTNIEETINIDGEDINYISLVGLIKDSDNNIRYYGNNPNNYISFNNELWRIIGIFNENDQDFIKIVRNDYLDDYSYGDSSNNWKISTIMKALNPNYSESSLYWETIAQEYREMLVPATYYLGSVNDELSIANLYKDERGNEVITWKGYLGLIYPSDYAYSRDIIDCDQDGLCPSYMDGDKEEYTISSIVDSNDKVFTINGNNTYSNVISSNLSIRPVGYINNKVNIVDGNGTLENPFKISLD